jgi:hypothetical protein
MLPTQNEYPQQVICEKTSNASPNLSDLWVELWKGEFLLESGRVTCDLTWFDSDPWETSPSLTRTCFPRVILAGHPQRLGLVDSLVPNI